MSTSVYISDLGLCLYLRRAWVCVYECVCFFGPIGLRLYLFWAWICVYVHVCVYFGPRSLSVFTSGLGLYICLRLFFRAYRSASVFSGL